MLFSVGGVVTWHGSVDADYRPIPGTGIYRVNGNLALSRAIGDAYCVPTVSGDPDIKSFQSIC
jgi:hypothetical protein